jgi:hypothetical protein
MFCLSPSTLIAVGAETKLKCALFGSRTDPNLGEVWPGHVGLAFSHSLSYLLLGARTHTCTLFGLFTISSLDFTVAALRL